MNSPVLDIKTYMQSVGQEARAASRLMAKASTGMKNRALLAMAAAIRRDADKLLAANETDLEAARIAGLEPAMLDRLALDAKGVESMGRVWSRLHPCPIRSAKSRA